MGVKRSLRFCGTVLGCLSNFFSILSTTTNYWIRFPGGHSGLWHKCDNTTCTNLGCETSLAVTGASMVLAIIFGLVGLIFGLRILCFQGEGLGQKTRHIFFLCSLLLLIALIGYTAKNTWKKDVFFSWSYFTGWLALPFAILTGFCFLMADMIIQSTDAISGFPVCL